MHSVAAVAASYTAVTVNVPEAAAVSGPPPFVTIPSGLKVGCAEIAVHPRGACQTRLHQVIMVSSVQSSDIQSQLGNGLQGQKQGIWGRGAGEHGGGDDNEVAEWNTKITLVAITSVMSHQLCS